MKFDCDTKAKARRDKRRAKYNAKLQWHKYFAWLPTRVEFADCRWMEYIDRRLVISGYDYGADVYWEYRRPQ